MSANIRRPFSSSATGCRKRFRFRTGNDRREQPADRLDEDAYQRCHRAAHDHSARHSGQPAAAGDEWPAYWAGTQS